MLRTPITNELINIFKGTPRISYCTENLKCPASLTTHGRQKCDRSSSRLDKKPKNVCDKTSTEKTNGMSLSRPRYTSTFHHPTPEPCILAGAPTKHQCQGPSDSAHRNSEVPKISYRVRPVGNPCQKTVSHLSLLFTESDVEKWRCEQQIHKHSCKHRQNPTGWHRASGGSLKPFLK